MSATGGPNCPHYKPSYQLLGDQNNPRLQTEIAEKHFPIETVLQDPAPKIQPFIEKYRFLHKHYKTLNSLYRNYEADILCECAQKIIDTNDAQVRYYDEHVKAAHKYNYKDAHFYWQMLEKETEDCQRFLDEKLELVDLSDRCYCDNCRDEHMIKDSWQHSYGLKYKIPENYNRQTNRVDYQILPRQRGERVQVWGHHLVERSLGQAIKSEWSSRPHYENEHPFGVYDDDEPPTDGRDSPLLDRLMKTLDTVEKSKVHLKRRSPPPKRDPKSKTKPTPEPEAVADGGKPKRKLFPTAAPAGAHK